MAVNTEHRGRKKLLDRPVDKGLRLPESLVNTVDLFLIDPSTGKVRLGAWSHLVSALLRDWLNRQAYATPNHNIKPPESLKREV